MTTTRLQASIELLAGQWALSPKLQAAVDAPLATIREEVLPALDRIERMLDIDDAEGVWLDIIGAILGLDRPAVATAATGERFGFEGTTGAVGFDQAPFHGANPVSALEPLPDEVYRKLIRTRGLVVLSDGTFQTFYKAAKILDPGARVSDNRNMTVSVVTTERTLFELAESVDALPLNAGVQIIYGVTGRFGFEGIGESFDSAPFRGRGG